MNHVALALSVTVCLWTGIAGAATVCSSREYPDHIEAVCVGDEKAPAVKGDAPAKRPVQETAAVKKPTKEEAATGVTEEQSSASAEPSKPEAGKAAAQSFAQRAAQWSAQTPQAPNASSSGSARRFQSYINNNPIQRGWNEKLAVRMRLIQEGQQTQSE